MNYKFKIPSNSFFLSNFFKSVTLTWENKIVVNFIFTVNVFVKDLNANNSLKIILSSKGTETKSRN